jgi:hypothetical protein
MFLNSKDLYFLSKLNNSIIFEKNSFFIFDIFNNNFLKNDFKFFYYINIKNLKLRKFFFKSDYYMPFNESDFLYSLNLFIDLLNEYSNDILLNGVLLNNQYLNITTNNLNFYYLNFLNNANLLLLYVYFLNIIIIFYFFLKKLIILLKKLC